MYDAASKAFSSYKLEINAQSVQINRTLELTGMIKRSEQVSILVCFILQLGSGIC